jgi:hypothetical protein
MFIAAASGRFDAPIIAILLAGGASGIVLAFVWRLRAQRKADALQAQRVEARIVELKRELEMLGTPIPIKGASGLWFVALLATVAAVTCHLAWIEPSTGKVVASIFLILLTSMMALVIWPMIGQPVLTIRREGLHTPSYGLIAWAQIEGMHLREIKHKGATVNHFLDLLVPDLVAHRTQFHAATRILHQLIRLGRSRRLVQIRLAGTTEPPQVIYRLCRGLWTARTGKDTFWYAGISEKHFDDLRKGKERLAALEKVGETIAKDPALAMKMLDEMEKEYPLKRSAGDADASRARSAADAREQMRQLHELQQRNRAIRQQLEIIKVDRRTHPFTWAVTIALILGAIVLIMRSRGVL